MPLPQLVMFLGGMGGSPVEDTFAQALAEDTLDTMERVLESGGVDGAILATDNPQIGAAVPPRCAWTRRTARRFTSANAWRKSFASTSLERIIYLGAGSATLMARRRLLLAGPLPGHGLEHGADQQSLLRGLYGLSCRAGAVSGPAAGEGQPASSRSSRRSRSCPCRSCREASATQFNIDTPSDLAILKLVGQRGPRLTAWLDRRGAGCPQAIRPAWTSSPMPTRRCSWRAAWGARRGNTWRRRPPVG